MKLKSSSNKKKCKIFPFGRTHDCNNGSHDSNHGKMGGSLKAKYPTTNL